MLALLGTTLLLPDWMLSVESGRGPVADELLLLLLAPGLAGCFFGVRYLAKISSVVSKM